MVKNFSQRTKDTITESQGRIAVIAYRKRDFKTLVLGNKVSNAENKTVVTYVKYPKKELGNGNGVWRTLGPTNKLVRREYNEEKVFHNDSFIPNHDKNQ